MHLEGVGDNDTTEVGEGVNSQNWKIGRAGVLREDVYLKSKSNDKEFSKIGVSSVEVVIGCLDAGR